MKTRLTNAFLLILITATYIGLFPLVVTGDTDVFYNITQISDETLLGVQIF
jgi:hypothetical protein